MLEPFVLTTDASKFAIGANYHKRMKRPYDPDSFVERLVLTFYKIRNICDISKSYYVENNIDVPIDELYFLTNHWTSEKDQIPIITDQFQSEKANIHRVVNETISRI